MEADNIIRKDIGLIFSQLRYDEYFSRKVEEWEKLMYNLDKETSKKILSEIRITMEKTMSLADIVTDAMRNTTNPKLKIVYAKNHITLLNNYNILLDFLHKLNNHEKDKVYIS